MNSLKAHMNSAKAQQLGTLASGDDVYAYQIHAGEISASVLNLGATLQKLHLKGIEHSLVLGSDEVVEYQGAFYQGALKYAGAIVGPVANRIANGQFQIADHDYQVDKNFLGRHCLHGGQNAASDQLWTLIDHQASEITLGLELSDQHMGFPGPISVSVRYQLTAQKQLIIEIKAKSQRLIPCNWTEHSYFNLDGRDQLADHQLQVFADHYLPVDSELIPTGEIRSVKGSQLDLRTPRSLDGLSLDHNFCIADQRSEQLRKVAVLSSAHSWVSMLVESNEPGLQVYTGDHLRTQPSNSTTQGLRAGVALEPQGWPDALNQPGFPSILLAPEDTYVHLSRYSFTHPFTSNSLKS